MIFISLLPGSGPRTKDRARAIAEDCIEHMRVTFPSQPWTFTITVGPEIIPVITRTFQPGHHSKALRWLVRQLEQPCTAVAVSLCPSKRSGG